MNKESMPDINQGRILSEEEVKFLEGKDEIRLMEFWQKHGFEAAKRFVINDADKFDDKEVRKFLENVLFEAGEDGVDKKTPWNTGRRQKAGLPMLFDYE